MSRQARRGTCWRLAVGVLTAAALLAPSGCVSLPESGPVVETRGSGAATGDDDITYDPLPPLPDASAAEVVKGFLDAMTAVPIQTTSAAEFLTQEARSTWVPERQTITYADRTAPSGGGQVRVRVRGGGDRYDARGAWQGSLTGSQLDLRFDMAVENGEWRIDGLPDALIVPESWFESRFRRLALYFFDPSARILVPEPVFVAGDDAVATRLVRGLLEGPGPGRGRTSRTFFPPGTQVELSVPVSSSGVADISLSDVGRLGPEAMRLMVTQLTWTLRQVPGISALRVTLDGQPLQLPDGGDTFPIDLGEEYDPAGSQTSGIVFGLRGGRLVGGILDALQPVDGPLGRAAVGLRSVAVDLQASQAAGVTTDGGSVVLAPVAGGPDATVRTVYAGGSELLQPAWDFAGRLWLVDRRGGRARVLHRADGVVRVLTVPGITGTQVRSFLVSRDGSRMVAVVRRDGRDELRIARLQHDDRGGVLRATPARRVQLDAGEAQQVRDLAWLSPTTVAALTRVAGALWEIRTISVDGAPASLESTATLSGAVRSLAGSPVAGQGPVVLTGREALDLSDSTVRPVPLEPGQQTLDYVG